MRTAAALLLTAMLCLPRVGQAQVIEGRVSDGSGGGLANVAVTVLDGPRTFTLTDRGGRFVLSELPVGSIRVHFARLGFAPLTATVEVYPGETTPVAVALSAEAIELDAIDVTVGGGGPAFLEINGFYQRTRRGFGRQITRWSLDEMRMLDVSDAVQNMPGLHLQHDSQIGNRVVARRPRGRRLDGLGCALTVYVDGVRTLDPNLNQIPPDWLVAMEVYLGADTPAQYRTSDNCGVVLLWTARY